MILIINGSPKEDSRTLRITKKLIENNDDTIITIDAYRLNVEPCDDCMYCNYRTDCKKQDDMDDIYKHLYHADTLIISSPIYFGGLSDQCMKIINRFQRFFSEKWVIKTNNTPIIKNLILISTAGSKDMAMFNGPLVTIDILSKLFQSKYVNHILVPNAEQENYITQEISQSVSLIIDQIKKR